MNTFFSRGDLNEIKDCFEFYAARVIHKAENASKVRARLITGGMKNWDQAITMWLEVLEILIRLTRLRITDRLVLFLDGCLTALHTMRAAYTRKFILTCTDEELRVIFLLAAKYAGKNTIDVDGEEYKNIIMPIRRRLEEEHIDWIVKKPPTTRTVRP